MPVSPHPAPPAGEYGPRPGGPQSRCPRSWRAEGESGRLDGRAGTGLREVFRNRDSSGVGQLTANRRMVAA